VQPWAGLSAPLGLPRNAATGRAYSGINILILWCAVAERGFRGPALAHFRQALKLGAHVRKGERGTTVVYADRFIPTVNARARRRNGRRSGGDFVPQTLHGVQRRPVQRSTVRQRADPCAPFRKPDPAQAEALIRATGADLRIGSSRTFYVPSADYIEVPSPAAYFESVNWHRTVCPELHGGNWEAEKCNRGCD